MGQKRRGYIYLFTGGFVLFFLLLLAGFAPFLYTYSYSAVDLFHRNAAPSMSHILGTDALGRDVFARLLYGARVSLLIGLTTTLIQLFLGTAAGVIAGYRGGAADFLIMRLVDMLMCFPFMIVAMAIASLLGPSLRNLIFIIAVLSWAEIARIVRAQILSLKKQNFILAAKMMGFSDGFIIFHHILPNLLPSIAAASTMSMANAILMEAALSFLGLGVRDPLPSWGNILANAQNMRALQSYGWTWLPAGISIITAVLAVNFIGEGIRILSGPLRGKEDRLVESSVDFSLEEGRILVIAGESGSGKTITLRSLLGLNPENISVEGRILFHGENLLSRSAASVRAERGKRIAMIFQEPMRSLDPLMELGKQVDEALKMHTGLSTSKRRRRIAELFREVRLENPEELFHRLPHELSGGMRQRVQIAMAIAADPEILLADEPTASVDEALKEEILSLLKRICEERGTALILVTHDLRKIESYADTVAVMYAGEMLESVSSKIFFKEPRHPYSAALLEAVPDRRTFSGRFREIPGSMPPPGRRTELCVFRDRCRSYTALCDRYFERRGKGTERVGGCYCLCRLSEERRGLSESGDV